MPVAPKPIARKVAISRVRALTAVYIELIEPKIAPTATVMSCGTADDVEKLLAMAAA